MTVPDEAIEAAANASWERANSDPWVSGDADDERWADRREYLEDAKVMLEAAAPYLRAQALEDAADGFDKACKMVRDNTYVDSGIYHDLVQQARGLETAAETLRARAAAERGPDV